MTSHRPRQLCVVPGCAVPHRHVTDCSEPDCPGCLPGLAADGLALCGHHERRADQHLRDLPGLDADLTLALNPQRGPSGIAVRGSKDPGLDLDEAVLDLRDSVRERLAAFVAFTVDERGLSAGPPAWTVPAVCRWLAKHAHWWAAGPFAGQWVQQLDHLTAWSRRRAYPTRPDQMLGECPMPVAEDGSPATCGGRVVPDLGDEGTGFATCQRCGTEDTIEWWLSQIAPDTDEATLLTATPLVAWLSRRYNRPVSEDVVRQWATREKVTRRGKDVKGRTLYDRAEVQRHADTVWTPVRTTGRKSA